MDERRFEHERKLTGMYRDALDAFREDARRIVREEAAAARPGPGEVEELVRSAVGGEMAAMGEAGSAGLPWSAAGLAAAMVIAALAVSWGVTVAVGRGGDASARAGEVGGARGPPVAGADSPAAPAPAPDEAGPRPQRPAELAARFDSLFASRDPRLGGVLATVPAPARESALDGWTADGDGDVAHNFLVQIALRALADRTLGVDGAVLRGPCRGETCGALIEHWRAHRDDPRYPPLGPDPAADAAALAQVERIAVLRHAGIIE